MTNVTDSQCRLIAIFGFFWIREYSMFLSNEAFKQIIRFAEQTKQEPSLLYFKILHIHRFCFFPLVKRLNPLGGALPKQEQ